MLSVTELFIDLFQDHAVVLGLSGDRCKHLLYRLQNGEMPDSLNPAAWWILIGTNDYPDSCSRESILVGQLAVLYETRKRKPDALVILQGLLPRGHDNLLESSLWQDFQWINDRLACLAELPQLDFFNGTSIFLADDEQLVNETLMDDFLHPSNEGRRLWGLAIVDHLKRLNIWTEKTPADG
jgi:lysophospholipase L1-like esterase